MMPDPISCNLTDPEQMRRQRELQEDLCRGIEEVVRLDDGLALRFPGETDWLARIARLMGLERECCPFLLLELRAEPEAGPLWLKLRGPEGTLDFLTRALRTCGVPV